VEYLPGDLRESGTKLFLRGGKKKSIGPSIERRKSKAGILCPSAKIVCVERKEKEYTMVEGGGGVSSVRGRETFGIK